MQLSDFTEEQRKVFDFHDGERQRFADPLRLRRQLVQRLGDPAALVAKMNRTNAAMGDSATIMEGLAATDQLVAGARDVFGMPSIDEATGKGTTDAMVLGVLRHFFRFCGGPRIDAAPPQPTSPSTASTAESTIPTSTIQTPAA